MTTATDYQAEPDQTQAREKPVETAPGPILHPKSVFGERRERKDGKIEGDCTHFSFVLYTVPSSFSVLRHLVVLLLWLRTQGTSCYSMQPIIKTSYK